MKRGDVVLVVAQGDIGKPRPGVIVQGDQLGNETTSVLICAMSSAIDDTDIPRPIIEPSNINGLRLRSQIMTDKIDALRRNRIRQVIGTLDPTDIERLDGALLLVLGLIR